MDESSMEHARSVLNSSSSVGLILTTYTSAQYGSVIVGCKRTGCTFSTIRHRDGDGDRATTIVVSGSRKQLSDLLEFVSGD